MEAEKYQIDFTFGVIMTKHTRSHQRHKHPLLRHHLEIVEDRKKSCDKDESSDWCESDHTEELRSLKKSCDKHT